MWGIGNRMPPLVTCICPTTLSRKRFWPDVLRCFGSQTYPDKELIFIVDGDERMQTTLSALWEAASAHVPDELVRLAVGGPTLGDKRNAGCEFPFGGSIIAHLDDDDLYAPGHLAHLVETLTSSGKAVTGYTSTTMREMRRVTIRGRETSGWWKLRSDTLMGGSLAYRRNWWRDHRFDSVNVGEDNAFIAAAEQCGQMVDAGNGQLFYCLRNHLGNVSGRCVVLSADCIELPDGGGWERLETA